MSVDFCVQALTSPQLDHKKKLDEVTLLRPAAVKPFDGNVKPFDWLQMPVFWQPWQQLQFALLSSVVAPRPTPLTDLSSVENLPPLAHRKRQIPSPDVSKKIKVRKLEEDTVTASPVSGMFIKEESCLPPPEELQREADELDETAAFVEVSEESRKQIGSIRNVIGDCVCKLCKVRYDDVFKLAQHRCPRIAHEEYNCPECDKTFSCPANLASHRRWHRPRDVESQPCPSCSVVFQTKRQLRAHLVICQPSLETLLNQMSPTSSF